MTAITKLKEELETASKGFKDNPLMARDIVHQVVGELSRSGVKSENLGTCIDKLHIVDIQMGNVVMGRNPRMSNDDILKDLDAVIDLLGGM